MQTPSESPRWPTELYADFCGALEGYAVTGEATKELDRLCGSYGTVPMYCPKLRVTTRRCRWARHMPALRKLCGV